MKFCKVLYIILFIGSRVASFKRPLFLVDVVNCMYSVSVLCVFVLETLLLNISETKRFVVVSNMDPIGKYLRRFD